jgi:hypothetical protein
LVVPQEYEIEVQAQLVLALTVLHNFIRIHDPNDTFEDDSDDEDVGGEEEVAFRGHATVEERGRAAAYRDSIAKSMWAQYIETRRRRL